MEKAETTMDGLGLTYGFRWDAGRMMDEDGKVKGYKGLIWDHNVLPRDNRRNF